MLPFGNSGFLFPLQAHEYCAFFLDKSLLALNFSFYFYKINFLGYF